VDARDVAVVILAKAPVAGRVKTRLCPPLTPEEAARVAAAALADTVDAVAATTTRRRFLVLDGQPGPWVPPDFTVVSQTDGGLDRRLAAAFDAVGGPAVLVGMDTPQLTPVLLDHAIHALAARGVDAVLGPAFDGGYWCIGLRHADPRVFEGIPMSASFTARMQLRRLRRLGHRVGLLPALRDVDVFDDALVVARQAPTSRFAAALASVGTKESVA
jgi:rSAM/selenodomain-associated transferase 1